MSVSRTAPVSFTWNSGVLRLDFLATDGPVRLVHIGSRQGDAMDGAAAMYTESSQVGESSNGTIQPVAATAQQPLVEVLSPRWGNLDLARSVDTAIGARMRYVTHRCDSIPAIGERSTATRLSITQHDQESGLTAVTDFEVIDGSPAVRATTTLRLEGDADPLPIWAVTSLATGAGLGGDANDLDVWNAASSWSAENRWHAQPLRARGLAKIDPGARGETSRSTIAASSRSTWSSGTFNPVGAVTMRSTGATLAWQIEHNGAWHWEVGERPDWTHGVLPLEQRVRTPEPMGPPPKDHSRDTAYVALSGPRDESDHWSLILQAGDTFTTVPVTVTVGTSLDEALGHLADHRRASRRRHPQNQTLPVIFNDYMNTLDGDPTEAKLLPLIDGAAAVGAEYFCIDAGWYDDSAGWWASVGDWEPSTARFDHGLSFVLDHIRSRGMTPGLWMEPEVVGVTSRAATELPAEAFLSRKGERVREHDRYFLDLRSPVARAHLDAAVDRLVSGLGVGYFKFDHNVTPGPGTDVSASEAVDEADAAGSVSAGHGLLQHNRALIDWLNSLLDRYPNLVIENCGAGAMRSDFAMLATLQLQSTSDQQDPLLYPAIAIGALGHILPEQAGNWAYPQPEMSDEEIIFAMAAGLSGRLYLSGVLSKMNPDQLDLVRAAVQTHHDTKHAIAHSIPRFPLGLPTWDDQWLAVAFDATPVDTQHAPGSEFVPGSELAPGSDSAGNTANGSSSRETYLVVWRLPAAGGQISMPLPHLNGTTPQVEQIFPNPDQHDRHEAWDVVASAGSISFSTTTGLAEARMYRLRH